MRTCRCASSGLESGNDRLQAIQPLNTRLLLQDGVLTLDGIDARLAQGRISGRIRVDGRNASAVWRRSWPCAACCWSNGC